MTAEVIEITGREVAVSNAAPATLYGTNEPGAILAHATAQANALAQVVEQQKLYATINGRKHVLLEGWTTLGALVGVFAVPQWTRQIVDAEGARVGWEARVEARTMSGQIVGAAEAECMFAEKQWSSRDDYALRSMAQTRASSKALRLPLGFIMTLAGFDATPADEMPREEAKPIQERWANVPKATVAPDKPPCPEHGFKNVRWVPGGVSKAGKDYSAFYSCSKECTAGKGGKGWTMFEDEWIASLQLATGESPKPEDFDADLPFE